MGLRSRRSHINIMMRRGALFVVALVLIFGVIKPGIVELLSRLAKTRTFDTNYQLKPLESAPQQQTAVMTTQPGEPLDTPRVQALREQVEEIVSERTATSSTFINNDGTRTVKYSVNQQNYLDSSGNWQKIDNTLMPAIRSGELRMDQFSGRAGQASVDFRPLGAGVAIETQGRTINMAPVGAVNRSPVKTGTSSVIYEEAWPGVDIEYELRGEAVKEIIVLKNRGVADTFTFEVDGGGKIIHHPTRSGELAIEGVLGDYSFSALTLYLQDRGVISERRVSQAPTKDGSGIEISIDADWLKNQPDTSFPMRIDPTYARPADVYWMYKSDGYSCGANNCYAHIGSLYDGSWKSWRTHFHFPINELAGKNIVNATATGYFKHGIGGNTTPRSIWMEQATCQSYWCAGPLVGATHNVSTDFNIDFTAGLQNAVNNHDWGAIWRIIGDEGAYQSHKTYYDIVAYVTYDTPIPMASPSSPSDKQTVITTQPSLKVNPVSDPDGDKVEYYFRVSTKPDAETGAIISSGWASAPEWTIPDGILQDGTTYYWHTYTRGAYGQTNPNWVRSFKVDLRTGQDSTQSYDTVGPVGIDIATGNATLATGTHSIGALGGSIGLNLTYNTPNRAKQGLKAEYWNIPQNYSGAPPNTTPNVIRRDQNINFDWALDPPSGGISADWFYVRWSGQFMAPAAGTYKFGGSNDDNMHIVVNNQNLYNQACYNSICFDENQSITLAAGQVVPITVYYKETFGSAYAKLYVKGAVPQQIVPSQWLYSDPINEPQSFGLTGHYYLDTGDHDIDAAAAASASRLMMVRQDTNMNLKFGTGGPAPGLATDNFLVRWTGYITVPEAGSYKLGAIVDDGIRIRVKNGANWTTVLDSWYWTSHGDQWGNAVSLPANIAIPISVDFREYDSVAAINLRVQNPAGTPMDIPTTWLTPNANVLPEEWQLGLNSGGAYQRLRTSGNSVILEDSTGSAHEYTYTNGGYKPPVGGDGTLTKNSDNTYTLVDVSGYTYIFDTGGNLTSLTSPIDAKQPAALKYIYAGDPARLIKIEDGVTSARYANIYYKGINDPAGVCDPSNSPNSPGTFFGLGAAFDPAPNGMLCAFETSDGDTTHFYYKNGQLARVVLPGSQITDYAYDSFGRITAVRDPLASDTIGAGIRTDDDSVTTRLYYDSLGRISSIKPPAATSGAARPERTFSYGIGQTDLHLAGASEPNGYSRRIAYDSLLRTTADTDLTGKTVHTEWDPVQDLIYSTTDPTGQKTTTIYDDDYRPIESYGPAPSAWYGSDRKPLQNYAEEVAHTTTAYDQGLKGPAVSWYNLKSANMTLSGAPKAYTTGFASNNPPESGNPAYLRHDFTAQPLPFTVGSGFDGYGFTATGKLRLPQGGTYTFTAISDDSVRLFIDDQQVFSNWGTKTTGATKNTLTGTFQATAGKVYRFTYQYGHEGMSDLGAMGLEISGPGIAPTRDWSPWLQPGYNLANSSTVYDSYLGAVTTTTEYSDPAYGLVDSATLDPSGLNYTSVAAYETPGSGYLRQTSKTLPGGSTTEYHHYGAADTRDNPCTPDIEAYHQAGFPKGKTDPTGRTSETIYDASGRVVASRYNDDPWTCSVYDTRGRVTTTTIPAMNGSPSRTITNNYAVTGNPLIASTTDTSGTITTRIDLLGQVRQYTDASGNETTTNYDTFGKVTSRTSPIGTETYTYDEYDRMTAYSHNSTTYATITYDEYSRIQRVDYPSDISLEPAIRDVLGRVTRATYMVGTEELYDEVAFSSSGLILSGEENGTTKEYSYDRAGRLTEATIGDDNFVYEFGAQDASCSTYSDINPNAAKNSNRTRLVKNNQVTTYCYDSADRLVDSSDERFADALYDTHGNTTSLGSGSTVTTLSYDASDRNTAIAETTPTSTTTVSYTRDVSDRIIQRTSTRNNTPVSEEHYVYTGGGSAHSAIEDSQGTLKQVYLSLPGAVTVTITPDSTDPDHTVYSLSNIHSDTMATVDSTGTVLGVYLTGPFGETLDNTVPDNSTGDTAFAYVGKHRKVTETSLSIGAMQMGARVYIPELGRFLQIDPVEGGTLNMYVYAMDPVNQGDLSGKSILGFVAALIAVVAGWAATTAVAVSTVRGMAGKPSAIKHLTHWTNSTGAPKTYRASDIGWKITTVKVSEGCKANGCKIFGALDVGADPTHPDEYLAIGGVSGKFSGEIAKREGIYYLQGVFTPDDNDYLFEDDGKPFNLVGRFIGGVFGYRDYSMRFTGNAIINQRL